MNKGIYIHIPFCVRKCLYCDFCSVADKSLYDGYTAALIKEIESRRGERADSVFIGGGTPTVLGEKLYSVIEAVCDNFILDDDTEFTVEANPNTVTEKLLSGMRARGVNRLSLGAQSFNDNELKALGRIHDSKAIFEAAHMARDAGFENLNLDIMLSTPEQTKESIKRTMAGVKEIMPEHVSAYSLIIEEGTPFEKMELDLPNEDDEREIYYYTVDFLRSIGLERYEISNFGKKCRHNIKYWTGKEYIGFGVSACSYENSVRFGNTRDIKEYIMGGGCGIDREVIDETEREKERFLLGLRMSEGVSYNGEFEEKIERLKKAGLIKEEHGRVMLTERGFDLGNIVFMEFI